MNSKTQIVIEVEADMVTRVFSDDKSIEVIVADQDTQMETEGELTEAEKMVANAEQTMAVIYG